MDDPNVHPVLGYRVKRRLRARRLNVAFGPIADLFAPAVPIATAIGRIPYGLDGMDYGTVTTLPWGVVYLNPASYGPFQDVPRHPDEFYELAGDFVIAAILIRLRGRLREGGLVLLYLVLFSIFRLRQGQRSAGRVGTEDAQWTALAILAVAGP